MYYGFRFNGSIKALGYRTFTISQKTLAEAAATLQAESTTPEEGAWVFITTAKSRGQLPATPQLDARQRRQRAHWVQTGRFRPSRVAKMVEKYDWRSFDF